MARRSFASFELAVVVIFHDAEVDATRLGGGRDPVACAIRSLVKYVNMGVDRYQEPWSWPS